MDAKNSASAKDYPIRLVEERTIEVEVGWVHLCPVCLEEFEAVREDARYCGVTCRSRAHRALEARP